MLRLFLRGVWQGWCGSGVCGSGVCGSGVCRLGAVQNQGETGPRAGVSWCGVGGVLVSWGKGDVCSDILSDKDHLLSSTIRPHYRAVRPPASCLLAIPLLFSLFSSLFSLSHSPLLSLYPSDRQAANRGTPPS